jgi:hypothetical protein
MIVITFMRETKILLKQFNFTMLLKLTLIIWILINIMKMNYRTKIIILNNNKMKNNNNLNNNNK